MRLTSKSAPVRYVHIDVVLSSNSLISCSFTLAKRSAIFFLTTNRIWSDNLLVEKLIKLHNSYDILVCLYNKIKFLFWSRNYCRWDALTIRTTCTGSWWHVTWVAPIWYSLNICNILYLLTTRCKYGCSNR